MIRRLLAAAMLVAVAVGASASATTNDATASSGPTGGVGRPNVHAPRAQRLYMVTDSVGLGAKTAIPRAFEGWDVTLQGTPALFVEMMESRHVRPTAAGNPSAFGDIAVVAGGYNYPYWDPKRFDRSIDSIIAAFREAGVRHVIWVTLREVKPQFISASAWRGVQPYYWYFPTVNAHLRAALDRHPDLSLADWAAIADRSGLTYDAIHLNNTGADAYANLIRGVAQTIPNRIPANQITKVKVAGLNGVPADATAVALNLTAVNPRTEGFVTAFPCGSAVPDTSNLNHRPAHTVAAATIVRVGTDGEVCLWNSADTHLLTDVQGYFTTDSGLIGVTPTRVADTRQGAAPAVQPADTPLVVSTKGMADVASPAAVAVNVTATGPQDEGFVTVYPCGTAPPDTSTLNFRAGQTVPNLAVVAPGADDNVCVVSSVPTHLIVDLFGVFTDQTKVQMFTPQRLFDSRRTGRVGAGSDAQVPIDAALAGPAKPPAALLNVTIDRPDLDGFVTTYPCGGVPPDTSTLNYVGNATVANMAVSAGGEGGKVCVRTTAATDIIVDIAGYLAGFSALTPWRALDSRHFPPR